MCKIAASWAANNIIDADEAELHPSKKAIPNSRNSRRKPADRFEKICQLLSGMHGPQEYTEYTKWLFRSGTSKWEFPIFPYSSRPLDHARQNSKAKLQVPRRWPHHGDAKRKPRQRDGRGSTRFDTSVRHSRTLTPSKLFMKTEIKITTRIFNSRKTAGKRSHCLNQRGWSHGNWMQFM